MDNREPYEKIGSVQKGPASPVLRPLEGKAAATWTGGAYEEVREHGQGARTPLACLPSLLRRSSFGYEGRVSAGQLGPRGQTLVAQHAPALGPLLAPVVSIYQHAREAAKALEKTVNRQAQQDAVCQRLMPVPGVGPLVASTYVATIDDPTRFATSTQVPAYLGLVPRVHQSGETHYHGRFSKEGDKLLRWL